MKVFFISSILFVHSYFELFFCSQSGVCFRERRIQKLRAVSGGLSLLNRLNFARNHKKCRQINIKTVLMETLRVFEQLINIANIFLK